MEPHIIDKSNAYIRKVFQLDFVAFNGFKELHIFGREFKKNLYIHNHNINNYNYICDCNFN